MSNKPVIFHDASVRANEVVANQKLAIGTSGETSELHIKAAAPEFRMEDNSGGGATTAFKIFADGGKTYIQSGVNFSAGSSSNIVFGNMGGGSEYINIGTHGLETTGNLVVNNIEFQQLQGLEQITNISNTTSNTLNTTSTAAATSTGTGAITCAGGVGVAGNVYSGGLVLTTSTEPSVSTTTGAIQVAGGVGVQGNVHVGSQLDVSGNVQVGTANLFVDTTTGYVGVGTTAPTHALDVHGTANVGALTTTSISGSTGRFTGNGDSLKVGTGGKVGITINDGDGNANITFNHASRVPDQDGSSGRIDCGVDGTTAKMRLRVKNSVTEGTNTGNLPALVELKEGNMLVSGDVTADTFRTIIKTQQVANNTVTTVHSLSEGDFGIIMVHSNLNIRAAAFIQYNTNAGKTFHYLFNDGLLTWQSDGGTNIWVKHNQGVTRTFTVRVINF